MQRGAFGYLAKPIELTELDGAVDGQCASNC
jgi:hypothetical protein